MPMPIKPVLCVMALFSSQWAQANPFQKPAWASEGANRIQAQSQEQTARQLQLKAILWSPTRPLANINGVILETGDRIAGFQVGQITEHSVQLESQGQLKTLSLQAPGDNTK